MPPERLIRFDGIIIGIQTDGRFRVRFSNGHEVVAEPGHDSDLPAVGDNITVEISPHNTSLGRLFFSRTAAREGS
jgi:translation initiation factor IF-1